MAKFNQNEYINRYIAEHYDRLYLQVPKGGKEIIRERAAQKGMSMNAYIWSLIEKDKP